MNMNQWILAYVKKMEKQEVGKPKRENIKTSTMTTNKGYSKSKCISLNVYQPLWFSLNSQLVASEFKELMNKIHSNTYTFMYGRDEQKMNEKTREKLMKEEQKKTYSDNIKWFVYIF